MKSLLLAVLCFVSAVAYAANPTWQQIDRTYFSTNGNVFTLINGRFSGDYGGIESVSNAPLLRLLNTNLSMEITKPGQGTKYLGGPNSETNAIYVCPTGFYAIGDRNGPTNFYIGIFTHRAAQDIDVGRYGQDLYLYTKPQNSIHFEPDPSSVNVIGWAWKTNNTSDIGPFTDGIILYDENTGNIIAASAGDGLSMGYGNGLVVTATKVVATSGAAFTGNGRGITNSSAVTQTNFISGAFYTNNASSLQIVRVTTSLTTAAVNGGATMDLMYDSTGGHSGGLLDRHGIGTTVAVTLVQTYTNGVCGLIAPGGVYWLTNTSQGSGNSSALVSGTGQLTTLP